MLPNFSISKLIAIALLLATSAHAMFGCCIHHAHAHQALAESALPEAVCKASCAGHHHSHQNPHRDTAADNASSEASDRGAPANDKAPCDTDDCDQDRCLALVAGANSSPILAFLTLCDIPDWLAACIPPAPQPYFESLPNSQAQHLATHLATTVLRL